MNARVQLAANAAALSQQKEDLANEVGGVRAMLQVMCDLSSRGRGTLQIEGEAFAELTDDLSRRLAAVSDRILKL